MNPEPREITDAELAWCKQMKALMRKKPKSITLFCNGNMHVLCSKQVNTQVKIGGAMPQPITDSLGTADGGDF